MKLMIKSKKITTEDLYTTRINSPCGEA